VRVEAVDCFFLAGVSDIEIHFGLLLALVGRRRLRFAFGLLLAGVLFGFLPRLFHLPAELGEGRHPVRLALHVEVVDFFFAQIDDLAALGCEILKGGNHGRSVKYRDRTFVEGHLESLIAEIDDNNSEAVGEGRPRGTKSSSLKTNLN